MYVSLLPFYHVSPGDPTQAVRFGGNCLNLLGHFAHLELEVFLPLPLVLESLCADHACATCILVQVRTPGTVTWLHVLRPLGVKLASDRRLSLRGLSHQLSFGQRPVYPHVTAFPNPPPPHLQPILCPRVQLSHRGPAQPSASSPLPATVLPSPSPFRSPPVSGWGSGDWLNAGLVLSCLLHAFLC